MRLGPLDISLRRESGSRETRGGSLENPSVSLSDPSAWQSLLGQWMSTAGPAVTVDTALGVPAFWCGVNVLASLMACLPLQEFKKSAAGREQVKTGVIAGMISGTVNDDYLTSYRWRHGRMISVLTTGAGRTYIERDAAGRPVNLWPMQTSRTTVRIANGRTVYDYRVSNGRKVTYAASEVIDLTFMDRDDGVSVFNPIERMRDTLGLGIALEQYASRFFQNGGVPPLALHTTLGSPQASARAKTDTNAAIRKANEDSSNVLIMPVGTELKAIGFDPEKGQMIEAQRFVIEQIARVLNLPPLFLQDLTHGTFTNSEQQDLHLTKHSATSWTERWEQEMNAKFYGRRSNNYVEFNLDGLLRGDFKTRMDGWAAAINSGQATPNEARRGENRPDMPGGDRLFIQGATVPLEEAGEVVPPGAPAETNEPAEPDDTQPESQS